MRVNPQVRKQQQASNGRTYEVIQCDCELCKFCWFNPLLGRCMYAGPYTGYEDLTVGTSHVSLTEMAAPTLS
jgi:hypothetical protein